MSHHARRFGSPRSGGSPVIEYDKSRSMQKKGEPMKGFVYLCGAGIAAAMLSVLWAVDHFLPGKHLF